MTVMYTESDAECRNRQATLNQMFVRQAIQSSEAGVRDQENETIITTHAREKDGSVMHLHI